MKIIAQKKEMGNRNLNKGKEGKMKKLAMVIMMVVVVLVSVNKALAYWKCDLPGVVIEDPAPSPFKNIDLK